MRGSTSTRSLFLTLWTLPRAGDSAKRRPVLARRIFGAVAGANSDLAHRPIAGCGSGLAGPLAFVHLLDPPRVPKSLEAERPLNGSNSSPIRGVLMGRTQRECDGVVEIHLLPPRPRRFERRVVQRSPDGGQTLLIFRPLIGIHREARGIELRLRRGKERRRPRRISSPEGDSSQPDELVRCDVPVPSLVRDLEALPKEWLGFGEVPLQDRQGSQVSEFDRHGVHSPQLPVQREVLPIERLRPSQVPLHPSRGGEHVQWAGGVFLRAPVSRDRECLLAPPSDFARVPPPEGQASETRRRANDETDVILLLRDGPTLLERPPCRVVVEIPEREDARAVEGSRAGDGPRFRSWRPEGFPQPRSRFFRVPPFLLEEP